MCETRSRGTARVLPPLQSNNNVRCCCDWEFPVYWELIVAFVDAGAAVQLNCGFGLTPLHIAVRYRRLDLIDALLAAGADASAQDDWGDVPAVYAMVGTGEQVWWGPW